MGQRGPPKKPTELKLLQGNPGRNPLPTNEPKPKKVKGAKPPRYLNRESRIIFIREAKKLEVLGLLTEIDITAFARYCDFLAKWLRVKARLDAVQQYSYPTYVEQTAEEINAHAPRVIKCLRPLPEVAQYQHFALMLNRLEREFGLTPASRASIALEPNAKERQDVEELLFGKLG